MDGYSLIQRTNAERCTLARLVWFVKAQRPSKQFVSHVGTEPPLPGYYQYFSGCKCVFAQGHNPVEVTLAKKPMGAKQVPD